MSMESDLLDLKNQLVRSQRQKYIYHCLALPYRYWWLPTTLTRCLWFQTPQSKSPSA